MSRTRCSVSARARTVRRWSGTAQYTRVSDDPGSAAHHCALRCARETWRLPSAHACERRLAVAGAKVGADRAEKLGIDHLEPVHQVARQHAVAGAAEYHVAAAVAGEGAQARTGAIHGD